MGCANEKLHAQQIAYQRDFLGACWNSVLGEDEAKEYLASRWMGVSRQVMGLYTNNHCFTVHTLRKEEETAAADPSKALGDLTGARPGVGGSIGVGSGGRQRSPSVSVGASPHAGSPPASPNSPLPVIKPSPCAPASGSFPKTTRYGQSGSNGAPYPANADAELSMVNARVAAAGKTKSANSGTLRTVMKDAIQLEKAAHSHHPYLRRHELSVYGGVVFRCAPAHRLYHRISFVPEARAKRLNDAPVSAAAGTRQDQQPASTPPSTSSVVAAPGRALSSRKRSRSSLETSGRAVKHSPLREGDGGSVEDMPALQLGSTLARHTTSSGADWETDDPLSASNNYPIEDRDVDGVAATRPPVIIGSITAMELQALPPNAELCFGGWLYVSLQDEQERLRRSLARYEKRRHRRAAAREAAIASSPMASSTWPTPSTFCKDSLSPGQSPGGRQYSSVGCGTVEGASNGGEAPLLRTSVVAQSMSAPRRLWQRRDSSDEMITRSQRPTAAAAAPPSPLGVVQEDTSAPPPADVSPQFSPNKALGDAVIADTEDVAHATAPMLDTTPAAEAANSRADGKEEEQPVQNTPRLSAAQSEERAAPAMKTAAALPPPQSQPSLAMTRPLNLSCNVRSAVASSAHSLLRATDESHKRVIKVPPQQPTPMLSISPLSPLRCTGKYAQEAMEAEALVASWLPYAYVVIAVPMYECSLVPTAFHTALIRRKAVSLNLADAQSRQAYGVGCITAARYGGVMVVEYREKISEDDDAEWIGELLRVGRASQQKYGEAGAKSDGTSTPDLAASAAAGMSTSSVRHLSRTVAHHARAEKLHRIKSCIWHKLRRQGLYVILASTRMADRRHRQQRAFVASELSRVFQASASWLGAPATSVPPHLKGRKSRHSAALAACASATTGDEYEDVDGIGCDYYAADMNGVVDYDSLDDNSDSDSRNSRTGRASRSSSGSIGESAAARNGGEGGGRRHSLWSKLPLPGGSKNHRHRRRHRYHDSRGGGDDDAQRKRHHSNHFGLGGQQRDGSGRLSPTAANPCLWAEPNYDDDFLLRGTYRQIGGMKYLDVVALIDGCPVSELVQGIKRWVVNLLSMPIKARPLCLYLQRYEGIASSLQLLSTQLASAALASSVASGHLVAPMNLSFHASGGTGLEAASFVSQQHAEAMGGAASTGSFSAASVPMNVSATASTILRGVPYNTYYRGPLDPVVRAVMSPEVESMIAACHTRQLPEVLRSPQLPAPHAVTSDGATDAGSLPRLPPPASVARRGSRDDPRSSSGHTSLTPQFLQSLSSSDVKRVVSVQAGVEVAAQVLCSPRLSTPRSPTTPHTGRPLCADPSPNPSASPALLLRKEQHETPTGSAAVQSSTTHVDPTSASLLPSAPLPAALLLRTADTAPPKHTSAGPSSESSECPLCDDSLQNDSAVGNNFTAANGRALAAAATASVVPGDSIGNPTGDGVTNGSSASPTVIDPLTAPPLLQDDWKQRETPSSRSQCFSVAASKGGATGDDTRPDGAADAEKPRCVRDSDDNASTGLRSVLDHTHYPGQRSLPERSETMAAAVARCYSSSGDDGASDDVDSDAAARRKAGGTACAGAEEEEASYGEREWQLADRELRALKSELDEMHYLVSTAHSELLQRLEESSQLGAIFLPHTRPDQVDLSLLTLKMMRQYPEEVPVKEIHTDWVPMLMSLLTISRDSLFCCAGDVGDTLGFLRTYNNAVTQSDACDADKRRELCDEGTTKYTIDPLPPLPAPRLLHDIVIAPQPIRLAKEVLREVKRVGMDETGLSFAFSGGSLGVLAGVLYYYTDFLRAKYRSGVAAAGRWPKEAGATVQDVLARDGYNVVLRRIWIWGVIPDSIERKSGITSAVAKTKQLLRGKPRRRDRADSANSTESTSTRCAEDANYVVTNTTGLGSGGARVRGQPFRSAEAYALYDAVLHYLRTLEELYTEHHGNAFIASQGAMKRRSVLMAWRRSKGGPDAAATAYENGGESNGASGSAAAASPAAGELVPKFEICVATNYYYKEMMEEARQPRAPARRSSSLLYTSGSLHHTLSETSRYKRLSATVPPPPAASSSAASGTVNAAVDGRNAQAAIPPRLQAGSAGSRAKAAKEAAERAQQPLEQPYCGGEETVRRKAPQRHAVKKIFGFLTEHYEQWRARHSDDPAANALAKRVHISIK